MGGNYMKKRLFSMMLVVAMAVSMFAGCGSKDAGEANATGTEAGGQQAAEEVEISFYTTETGKDDMFLAAIEDFESKNPGITVEYIAAGDDQLQKWMSLYASNEGPTVSFMDPINIFENQERMRAYDKEANPWLSQVSEAAFSTVTFDGKIYGVPGTAAGIGILYNKAVCDAAVGGDFDPSTIKSRSDLEELFQKIEATGAAATMFTGVNWSIGAHFLGIAYGDARGDVNARLAFVADEKAGKKLLAEDKVFNGLMDTFDMMAKYNYNKEDPLVGNVNLDAEALATGKVGTWFMGDWAWTYMAALVEEGQEFGLLPIPVSDDENDFYNTIIPTSYAKAYCIDASQNTEAQQLAGQKFVEYLVTDEYCTNLFATVCGQALPYANCTAEIESPLGRSTAAYIAAGLTYDFYGTADMLPSDFWYENGAYMCEYLAGACDRAALIEKMETYWQNQN